MMKKLLLALFICMFLISIVSAAEWDNVKSYDGKTKTVTIKNALGLPLIGENIATATLNTPQVYEVGVGYNKVAQFTINSYQNYSSIFKEIEFHDLRNDGEIITRDIDIKYLTTEQIEVVDYKTECTKVSYTKNSSYYDVCSQIKTGSHLENKEVWKDFDGDIKLNELVIIGLFTNVYDGDDIEWIPTIAGVKVNEWAEWTADLNVNLVAYYKFDEGALNGGTIIDLRNIQNGTNNWGTNTTGIINYAYNFNGSNPYVNINLTNLNISVLNYTINCWIYPTYVDLRGSFTDKRIYGSADFAGTSAWNFEISDVGSRKVDLAVGNATALGATTLNNNTWYMVTGVYNNNTGNISVYLNGVIDGYGSGVSGGGSQAYSNALIGGEERASATVNFEGKVDGCGFWNATLNQSSITQLYNGGVGMDYVTSGSTIPTITLINPTNEQEFVTNSITFATLPKDADNATGLNVTIYTNTSGGWDILTYNGSSVNNSQTNFTHSLLSGVYKWNARIYDGIDYAWASNQTFAITTAPTITLTFSISGQAYLNNSVVLGTLPVDLDNATGLNVTIFTNESGVWDAKSINTSALNNSQTNFTITFSPGTYLWNALVSDGFQDNFASSNETFSISKVRFDEYNYSTNMSEMTSTTLKQNFSINPAYVVSAVNLTYNQTNYSASFSGINTTNYEGIISLLTPEVNTNTNITFNWTILLNDSTFYTSDSLQQLVTNFLIDNCTTNTVMLFNFTQKNERTQVNLTSNADHTNIKVDLKLYPNGSILTPTIQYFHEYNETNRTAICVNNTLGGSIYYAYLQVEYDATDYADETYNIQNYSLNASANPSQNITLFDLADSESQVFTINYKDSSFLNVQKAIIQIQRKYIEEGIAKIVEIPLTDYNGEAVAHLVLNDIIYSFIVAKDGTTLATFNDVYAICQNPTLNTCEINLNSFSSNLPSMNYETAKDFTFTLDYNESAATITSVFSIPSGAVSLIYLNVSTEDALGTSVCNKSVMTSSGTLTCPVTSTFGNGTVTARLYRDSVYVSGGSIYLGQDASDIYGGAVVVLGLLLMLTLIGAGISHDPRITVAFFLVGVVLLYLMTLVNGTIGVGSTILFLVMAIILIIVKGGRAT